MHRRRTAPPLVCIDPGHPSEYSEGTQGRHISERALNWRYALLLKTALEKRGLRVLLTKQTERQRVTNRERAEIANRANAALLVRLHGDARPQRGFAVYYPSREGKTKDGTRGPSADVIKQSRTAATALHAALRTCLTGNLPDFGLWGDEKTGVGQVQGALTGSIYSRVPVVLVEMGSVTNRQDEDYLLSRDGSATFAEALATGVQDALEALREKANQAQYQ